MSAVLHFFATGADLKSVLSAIEMQRPLRYVLAGSSVKPEPETFTSSEHLPNLGISIAGDRIREPSYLITDENIAVEPEVVPQRRGGTLFFFNQSTNPQSIILCPGGVFQEKFVIAGNVGTCSPHKDSEDLMKLFSRELRRRFSKLKSYYIGEEALCLFNGGLTLAFNVHSPAEYHLKKE